MSPPHHLPDSEDLPITNEDLKKQLDRLETCLVGDPNMGHRGLVYSRDNHETRITALERIVTKAIGIAAAAVVIGGLIKFLWEIFKR